MAFKKKSLKEIAQNQKEKIQRKNLKLKKENRENLQWPKFFLKLKIKWNKKIWKAFLVNIPTMWTSYSGQEEMISLSINKKSIRLNVRRKVWTNIKMCSTD